MPLMDTVTMEEFHEGLRRSRTVVLPCGSLEEHGVHLPLGTDTWHAVELAKALSERIFLWVAPPICYGLCRSSSQHPGTVGLRGTTLRLVVQDVIRGFVRQGLDRVLVLSGHAGGTHMAMIVDACEELMEEISSLRCAVVSINELGRQAWRGIVETSGDSHAGEVETSFMMYRFPHCIRGEGQEEYPSFPPFVLVRDKRRYWYGGVWGNPAKASPQKGERLFARSVEALCDVVRLLEEQAAR